MVSGDFFFLLQWVVIAIMVVVVAVVGGMGCDFVFCFFCFPFYSGLWLS